MTLEEKLNEFKAEGIAEGKKKKAIETAKNLLLMTDFSIDKISSLFKNIAPFLIILILSI